MVQVLAEQHLEHIVRFERLHADHAYLSGRHVDHVVVRPAADRAPQHSEQATPPYLLQIMRLGAGSKRGFVVCQTNDDMISFGGIQTTDAAKFSFLVV